MKILWTERAGGPCQVTWGGVGPKLGFHALIQWALPGLGAPGVMYLREHLSFAAGTPPALCPEAADVGKPLGRGMLAPACQWCHGEHPPASGLAAATIAPLRPGQDTQERGEHLRTPWAQPFSNVRFTFGPLSCLHPWKLRLWSVRSKAVPSPFPHSPLSPDASIRQASAVMAALALLRLWEGQCPPCAPCCQGVLGAARTESLGVGSDRSLWSTQPLSDCPRLKPDPCQTPCKQGLGAPWGAPCHWR